MRALSFVTLLALASAANAQSYGSDPALSQQPQPQADQQPQPPPSDVPPPPPAPGPDGVATPIEGAVPPPGLQTGPEGQTSPPPEALLDGHVRSGPFLAGPGSFTFVLHNSILAGLGGLGTQLISAKFDLNKGKEGMLIGTLVGAGLGFGLSTWWQFTHWMDHPVAAFSLINGLYAGALAAGLVDAVSPDLTALAYASFICAELGGWLTAAVGGGEMRMADGLAIASGGAWAGAYAALVLATLTYAGGAPPTSKQWVDALLIAPGLGAAALATALYAIHPSANQVIRGDLFGLGVGAAVLLTSGFVIGWQNPTSYILTLLTSAGALAAVSIFWEEAAERPASLSMKKKPYNNPWW